MVKLPGDGEHTKLQTVRDADLPYDPYDEDEFGSYSKFAIVTEDQRLVAWLFGGYIAGKQPSIKFGVHGMSLNDLGSRLVACWNACRGIETANLEKGHRAQGPLTIGGLVEVANTARDRANTAKARAADAERLLEQSAVELEEAGKLLRHEADLPGVGGIMEEAAERNRTFLSGAKPQPDPNVKLGDEVEQEGGK